MPGSMTGAYATTMRSDFYVLSVLSVLSLVRVEAQSVARYSMPVSWNLRSSTLHRTAGVQQQHFEKVAMNGRRRFPNVRASVRSSAALTKIRQVPLSLDRCHLCRPSKYPFKRIRSVELVWRTYTEARRVIIWIGEMGAKRPTYKRLYPGTEQDGSQSTLCAKSGLAALEHSNLAAGLSLVLQDQESESSRRLAGEV